jgi:GNAT superfamily N-acetyltransferase
MAFVIRIAKAADVPAMHRVRNQVRENRLSSPQRVSEESYMPYVLGASIWLAETPTAVLGFAAVDPVEESVWALFVDPEAEGLGVGRALHQRMLTWSQERGISQLTLSTEQGTRAAQFYQGAGWTEAGSTPAGEAVFKLSLGS